MIVAVGTGAILGGITTVTEYTLKDNVNDDDNQSITGAI